VWACDPALTASPGIEGDVDRFGKGEGRKSADDGVGEEVRAFGFEGAIARPRHAGNDAAKQSFWEVRFPQAGLATELSRPHPSELVRVKDAREKVAGPATLLDEPGRAFRQSAKKFQSCFHVRGNSGSATSFSGGKMKGSPRCWVRSRFPVRAEHAAGEKDLRRGQKSRPRRGGDPFFNRGKGSPATRTSADQDF
jgi:hypothetical protein